MDGRELRRTLDVHASIARAYADDRFPSPRGLSCDLRMLTVTILWVVGIERTPKGERWTRVCEAMHLDNYRFWQAIREDVPRYEPSRWDYQGGACEAPMIRREGTCGRTSVRSFRTTDPSDGTWRMAGFCNRHTDWYQQAYAAERARMQAGGIPEPLPNTGGLLPCYVNWNWPANYAQAKPGWKPPRVGICADDWPVMAKVAGMAPPALSLIAGEGEADPLPSAAPSLRLV